MSLEKALHKIVQRLPIAPHEKDALEMEVSAELLSDDAQEEE